MIGIRADANEIIASGHIMRCIAIAEQIENSAEQVIFITSDHFSDTLLDEKGYKHTCLDSDWQNKISELESVALCLKEYNITTLLVDSYEVTRQYLQALHNLVKVVYIDDMHMFVYPVDMVINYTIETDESQYDTYNDNSVQFLLGPKYIPLRKEFENNSNQIKSDFKNVIITTGGSDNYHLIHSMVNRVIKINSWNDICFHIIIGGFFCDEDILELESISSKHVNIVLHKDVKNMAKIMLSCDLAVSAGGTTLAELCACGLPTICFAIAKNQLEGVSAYGKSGVMVSVGDIRHDLQSGVDEIIRQIELLKNSKETRQLYAEKAKALVDGSGAKRIAERICILDMKVLFFQWDAFMQKGIVKAFDKLNIDYDTFYYQFPNRESWDKDDEFVDKLLEKLKICEYDVVFSVNFSPLISEVCNKSEIKYISWVYDSPIHIRRTDTLKNSCNKIYFFDRGQANEYLRIGIDTAYHMPLAVDVEVFEIATTEKKEDSKYSSDISFVGQLYKSEYSYLCGPLDEYQRGFLEGIVNAQLKIYGGYFLDDVITDDFMKCINERYQKASNNTFQIIKDELIYAMACEVTGRERYLALAILSNRYHVNLYSKDTDDRLSQIHFKGYVDYYSQMPKVFAQTKVNINISLKTIRTGIPLRILDIMACGGFLITNYQEEIMEYFEPGIDLVIYESIEDMVLKVDYYLKHEDERQKIAQNGCKKVKELFGFEDRIISILSNQ